MKFRPEQTIETPEQPIEPVVDPPLEPSPAPETTPEPMLNPQPVTMPEPPPFPDSPATIPANPPVIF